MITRTVKDLLTCADDESPSAEYCLYVVRVGVDVLYVGQTTSGVAYRLHEHVFGGCRSSSLGRMIIDLEQTSGCWMVDLYRVDECKWLVEKHFPEFRKPDHLIAERALIWELHPALNVIHNEHPKKLPAECIALQRKKENESSGKYLKT